jgi:hypothetical protein
MQEQLHETFGKPALASKTKTCVWRVNGVNSVNGVNGSVNGVNVPGRLQRLHPSAPHALSVGGG